jgi:hypothetical protein
LTVGSLGTLKLNNDGIQVGGAGTQGMLTIGNGGSVATAAGHTFIGAGTADGSASGIVAIQNGGVVEVDQVNLFAGTGTAGMSG